MDRLDRVRYLLDLVVASIERPGMDGAGLAGRAFLSRFHFDRLVRAASGEPPGAFRRRLLLERAAYRLVCTDAPVHAVAAEAGYGSVEAFTRAFSRMYGRPPSAVRVTPPVSLWLPAPNGVHFHPPGGLRLLSNRPDDERSGAMDVVTLMLRHDTSMVDQMLRRAGRLPAERLDQPIMISVGHPERAGGLEGITDRATLRSLLTKLVWEKEMWLAAVRGELAPEPDGASLAELQDRHTAAAGEFERMVGTVLDEGRGDETFIDATCDPPESFTFTGMVAHVLTFAAYRRTLALGALIDADITDLGIGNPITFRADGTAHGDAPQ